MSDSNLNFYSASALLSRLTDGLVTSQKPVVFLVGSGLNAPVDSKSPGVPLAAEIVEIVRDQFSGPLQVEFDEEVDGKPNAYQAAFNFLIGHRGQDAANMLVRQSVARARKKLLGIRDQEQIFAEATSEEACAGFEADFGGWHLNAGTQALGLLMSEYSNRFGKAVLTTNFDPLLSVSVRQAGGVSFRTMLHRDGSLSQTSGDGTHVIHLHGYWYGTDTLHTPRQLTQERPRLKASLTHLLNGRTLVVMGYGGWDDVFTQALIDSSLDDLSSPEIIWTFRDKDPTLFPDLAARLSPGLDRGRVTLYSGIDSNDFIPRLLDRWRLLEQGTAPEPRDERLLVQRAAPPPQQYVPPSDQIRFESGDGHSPPSIDFFVGRSSESKQLEESSSRVVFVTGMGGQGKSALAARYFIGTSATANYTHRVWRDCREESERFEEHLVKLVHGLSRASISLPELAAMDAKDLCARFVELTADTSLLVVFDNVDSYVDLEHGVLTGAPAELTRSVASSSSKARLVFTCRPEIKAPTSTLNLHLEGLGLRAAEELFELRGVHASDEELQRAHTLTGGHTFWLSLIAAQVAQRIPPVSLEEILDTLEEGKGELPTPTLKSIWSSLKDRERVVLQGLAETVRPTTETELADFLRGKLQYNKFQKALRTLRSLNLVVSKPHEHNLEVIELHPLVKSFIRATFSRSERKWFIDAILTIYDILLGPGAPDAKTSSGFINIQRWVEATELHIESGDLKEAFRRLLEVSDAYSKGGSPNDFVRVARLLFNKVTWEDHPKYPGFDELFNSYFDMATVLGRTDECLMLLERYRDTVPHKDARYINLCDRACFFHWHNGNYMVAIRWGKEGVELKQKSNVDTGFDAKHHLSLAQRDSGAVNEALEAFLEGEKLSEVIDPQSFDEDKGGPFYGNIGRCLHLMGQVGPALVCYKKSGLALEATPHSQNVSNQGYARLWVSELVGLQADRERSSTFMLAAYGKWKQVAPTKASQLRDTLQRDLNYGGPFDNSAIERAEFQFQTWLRGTD